MSTPLWTPQGGYSPAKPKNSGKGANLPNFAPKAPKPPVVPDRVDRVPRTPATPIGGLAASQARYEGMGRTMAPSGTSVPLPQSGGDQFDGSPFSGGDDSSSVPSMLTDEEYLTADSIFQAQKNALQAALDAYLADVDAQQSTYATNYGDSLRKLGFTGDQGALDKAKFDPTDNRWEDEQGNPFAGNINWNQTDTTTASGRGFENILNDFASRGMLQSSAYQRAYNNMQRQLNEQLASTAGAKQTAFGEFDRGRSAKRQEKTTAEATASQEALARIKAAYGIG